MAVDEFLKQTEIESGYFAKRKEQFNSELAKGIAQVQGKAHVRNKPKHKTNTKKTEDKVTGKLPAKSDLANTPPNQLTGKDFVERMRLAREAKQKAKKQ